MAELACQKEVLQRLTDLLDAELDASLRSRIEIHLRDCEDCRSVLEQLRVIVSLAASVGHHDQDDPTSMSPAMRQQLMS
jgi:predicted anti-sigma-YlaC factor YlaD